MIDLENKTVVIIGGSSGIGLATSSLAAKLGANLIIAGRSVEKLEIAKKNIGSDKCEIYTLDNRTPENIEEFFNKITPFHHLFTPAASYVKGPITSDLKTAESCFQGKFWPQYWAAKYSLTKIDPLGSIVFMSGAFGTRPDKNGATYAACNKALEALAKALAIELAPIRVNAVAPGTIKTEFVWEGGQKESREEAYQAYASECLLKRVGHADEVALAVIYLMLNSYTTGTTLFPDGGYTLI